jgi:hypothetical protein
MFIQRDGMSTRVMTRCAKHDLSGDVCFGIIGVDQLLEMTVDRS